MVSYEHELKNAYIGEVYEYNYTFKGKTASQIQGQWTVLNGTLGVNSDGFTGTSSADCWLIKTIPSLSNAKKITITGTVVVNSTAPNNNAAFFGIGKGSTNSITDYIINRVEGSTYSGINVAVKTNGTVVNGNAVGNTVQGTYTQTLTIDLENKQVIGAVSGFSNSTLTLTDAQIAVIRTFTWVYPYVSLNFSAVSNINITVE